MAVVDLYDWYVNAQGGLNRWDRGGVNPPQPTVPGAPLGASLTVSGTVATFTWLPPSSTGGSPITGYTTTLEGGATHTLGAAVRSDTFTVAGGGPFRCTVAATNIIGTGPASSATTSATTYRFPGDTLPLITGKIMTGATETDDDGTVVRANWEFVAPETVTGFKYGIIKQFMSGSSVLSTFTANTGAMATNIKNHYAKGHVLLFNVAIQQSGQTWRQAADGRNSTLWDNWITWVEEGAAMPNCPVWLCMPHEAQQPTKTDLNPANGMLQGDYADLQVAFRARMDAYATAKAGSPGAYKWKHLAFGGIHTGEAFSVGATSYKNIDNYYTSHLTGLAIPKRTHDFVGGDPYQVPISGATTPGRTGFPMWNTVSQAMAAWCKGKGYPIVWGEFGIHNNDADAAFQLQDFWNHVTDGTHDVVAIIYWNSTPNGPFTDPATTDTGRFLLVDNDRGGGLVIPNGNFASEWYTIMRDPKSVRFWDLGYTRPPGI